MFDKIQDLPVSEETLGAYIDGNLNNDEAAQVESIIVKDSDFSNFVDQVYVDDYNSENNYCGFGFCAENANMNNLINIPEMPVINKGSFFVCDDEKLYNIVESNIEQYFLVNTEKPNDDIFLSSDDSCGSDFDSIDIDSSLEGIEDIDINI